MPNAITLKRKVKLLYTESAFPLILEALGYRKMVNDKYLVYLSDGSYVKDKDGKRINVDNIIGFQKGRLYTRKNEFGKIQTRKLK